MRERRGVFYASVLPTFIITILEEIAANAQETSGNGHENTFQISFHLVNPKLELFS